MTKFVNRPVPESGPLGDSRNDLAEIARIQGVSVGRGEDEVLVITPRDATKQGFLFLVPTMTFQKINERRR
jgi:hypothetical protein